MSKLLITGSSGFIGSYFLENYKEKYEIKTFSFLKDNFDSLECEGLDVVLHLSALVHQMGGASEAEYERVNVAQTLRLARKAKESGVGHFVFMSSVKVYGEESDGVYTEMSLCLPEDEYGKSKLKAELELQKLEDKNFKVSIIRTPIVYGHGVKANIKSLVNLVKKVSVLPFGAIKNRRSMVYVGNLCHLVDEVIRLSIESVSMESGGHELDSVSGHGMTGSVGHGMTGVCHPELDSGSRNIFLACDDAPLSTTRLMELIAKALGKRVYILRVPFFESLLKLLKPSFHKRLYGSLELDNTYTKEKLHLQNPYSVEEGVAFMLRGESIDNKVLNKVQY